MLKSLKNVYISNSTYQNSIFTYTKSKICNFLILLPSAVSLDVGEWNPHGARGSWQYLRCLLMPQLLFCYFAYQCVMAVASFPLIWRLQRSVVGEGSLLRLKVRLFFNLEQEHVQPFYLQKFWALHCCAKLT